MDTTDTTDEYDDAGLFGEPEAEASAPADTPTDTGQAASEEAGETPAEPLETQPEAVTETEAEPEPKVTPEGMMPYGAYQSEKAKRQEFQTKAEALEQEVKRLSARNAVYEQMQQKPQTPNPDPLEDPQAYSQHVEGRLSDVAKAQKARMDRVEAIAIHGADTVNAAYQAAAAQAPSDPVLNHRLMSAPNPIAAAVEWHTENQKAQAEQEAFRAWQASQQGQPQSQPGQSAPIPNQAKPPPIIPPNNASRPATAPARQEMTYEDADAGLWGNR